MSGADNSLMDLFREEARSNAATLVQGLVDLESNSADPAKIEPLMRAAHSIKGAAHIVNLEPAVRLAHVMEDALVAAQTGRIRLQPSGIDVLLRGTDVLASLAQISEATAPEWSSQRETEIALLADQLRSMAQGTSTAQCIETLPSPMKQPVPSSQSASSSKPDPVEPLAPRSSDEVGAAAQPADAVVRVTAQSLNRLMGFAGESLVQGRWLQPFATSLLRLKKHQDHLAGLIEGLSQALSSGQLTDQVGGLVAEAREHCARCGQALAERMVEFENHAGRAEDLNGRLYREVIVSRMRPFADGAHGFPRLVRDMARNLDKQVRLEIKGETTEVDRDVLEKLEAPITHLIRNAVDHGIEPLHVRSAIGKPETGLVRVEAHHSSGMLAITVSDDGSGIDPECVRRKVVDRGLATAEVAGSMGETELLEFLFLPGFSTAAALTEYSGRGVGLDVVQTAVRRIGGLVRITTRPGQGTSFHLQLPITLSVLRAVLVEVGGEPYAFPHNRIDRLLRVPMSAIHSVENRQFITVDGQNVGLVLAAQLLGLPEVPPPDDDLSVILLTDPTGAYGLMVEAFRGEQDLVVRPLDARLGKLPDISAAAILDDGSPVLVVDVEDLIRSMDQFIQSGSLRRCEPSQTTATRRKRVLVVDDSITIREVERQLLRGHGYDVAVAVDGQDGWKVVQSESFDLVITDVDMPRMDGLALVRSIRESHPLKNLPVIIVSYKDREEDRLRGLEAGASYYLTKSSFHDHTFLQAVKDLIGDA